MNHIKLIKIVNLLYQNYKNVKTKLKFNSYFELLISTILSAQTKDQSVNIVAKRLYKSANTPEKMLLLGKQKIKKKIKNIGLYNKKTNYIINTSTILFNKFNNKIPNNRSALESLPGVGRKTANIILNLAFGKSTIAVDTHVFRVSNRTGIVQSKNYLEVEKRLNQIVPKKIKKNFHQCLVYHGQNICIAKKPKCQFCFLKKLCKFKKNIDN